MAKQKLGPNQSKWLKALESGEFKQTKAGALKTKAGSYCCLGVACELFKTASTKISLKETDYTVTRFTFNGEGEVAPPFVIRALALRNDTGSPPADVVGPGIEVLTEANDAGKRFKKIAEMVRSNPAAYFKRSA